VGPKRFNKYLDRSDADANSITFTNSLMETLEALRLVVELQKPHAVTVNHWTGSLKLFEFIFYSQRLEIDHHTRPNNATGFKQIYHKRFAKKKWQGINSIAWPLIVERIASIMNEHPGSRLAVYKK
jgi:hypothetical protein